MIKSRRALVAGSFRSSLISNYISSSRLQIADPTIDNKPPRPQIPFSRTPHIQNTLDDDVTKPEKKNASTVITKRMNVVSEDELVCPTEREARFELFPLICSNNQDCEKAGQNFRCCKLFGSKRCHEGLEKPLEELEHERKIKFA